MDFKRESIFVSAVRSFCTSFSAILGLLIGLIVIVMGLMFMAGPNIFPEKSNLTIASDAEGNRDLLPASTPVVLKLNITGVIGQGDLTAQKFQDLLFDSRDGMLSNNRVKAVLLYINTPGGTVTDSNAIYLSLLEYKKKYQVPVYAYVSDLCASGGMYVASAADKIFASSASVIGSVGVILGPMFNFSGLMDRYGVQSLTLTEGKDKDMLNPFRPWQPGEDTSLRHITEILYDQFVTIVTTARPRLERSKLVNEYGAQVYVAEEAEKKGYIDVANSDYRTTLIELTKAAHFPEDHAYQVVELESPRPFLSDLAHGKFALLSGKLKHVFPTGPNADSELSGKFLYLYQPTGLNY